MDNMLEHPWTELQLLIKEKWLTQKAFSSILWKKVSEVNELLKWKRNITIQRDYLLHQTLWTPIKYWILKQVDYDYSLISPSFWTEGEESRKMWQSVDSSAASLPLNDTLIEPHHPEHNEESINNNMSSWALAKDLRWEANESSPQDSSSLLSSEWQKTEDEDLKNRADIFRSF